MLLEVLNDTGHHEVFEWMDAKTLKVMCEHREMECYPPKGSWAKRKILMVKFIWEYIKMEWHRQHALGN